MLAVAFHCQKTQSCCMMLNQSIRSLCFYFSGFLFCLFWLCVCMCWGGGMGFKRGKQKALALNSNSCDEQLFTPLSQITEVECANFLSRTKNKRTQQTGIIVEWKKCMCILDIHRWMPQNIIYAISDNFKYQYLLFFVVSST